MKNRLIAGGVALGLSLAGCAGGSEPVATPEQTVFLEGVRDGVELFDSLYGFPGGILPEVIMGEIREDTVQEFSGFVIASCDLDNNLIVLNQEVSAETLSSTDAEFLGVHESTHCAVDQDIAESRTHIAGVELPIEISRAQGLSVVAVSGLQLVIETTNGQRLYAGSLEEAAAEVIADASTTGNNRVHDPASSQYAPTQLLIDMMEDSDMTPIQLADYISTTDIGGFVSDLNNSTTTGTLLVNNVFETVNNFQIADTTGN